MDRRRFGSFVPVALSIGALILPPDPATLANRQTLIGYRQAVGRVCAHPLLFASRHEIGTRLGAIAVSRDIRATGNGRLRRVGAIPRPRGQALLATRWIAIERRLVDSYARTYLRIWFAIENARTSPQRARLPGLLRKLVHVPDALAARAGAVEAQLRLPDCTGGTVPRGAP